MSTYLDRLVKQLYEPEMEIQPRLPALFEPAPGSAWVASLNEAAQEFAPHPGATQAKEEPAGAAGEVNLTLSAGPEPPATERHGFPPEPLVRPGQHGPEQAPGAHPPVSSFLAGESPPANRQAPRPSTVPPAAPPERSAAPAPWEPRPGKSSLPAASPTEEASDQPPARLSYPPAAPPEVADSPALLEPWLRGSSLPAASPLEENPARPRSAALLQPAGTTSQQPLPQPVRPVRPPGIVPAPGAPAARPPQAEPGLAPRIQVTIGRIEVRAAPPPAAPRPAPTRRGPTVSLEAYLKRRNGGSS